jgi:DNA helicase-2/ATP-dependent DNA helicase PcrA
MPTFPGPPSLGRGIVVGTGDAIPPEGSAWQRLVVGEDALAEPAATADELHVLWLKRQPVVVELCVDPDALRERERCDRPPYELGPSHDFARERLQYLVWSNNYDGRAPSEGPPIWWHGRRAERLGAAPGELADIRLGDGTEAWCDGGPRGPVPGAPELAILHRESIEAGSLRLDRSPPVTSELAPDQLRAVSHGSGPARIIAPAGSGKTRVLTERLRHLLADRLVTPGSVLAVAFNKRAADELVERTGGLSAHIRTLNALGLAIVNGSPPFAATGSPQRRVIDEREVRQILQSLITVRRQVNTDPWVPYLEALSAIRLGLAEPDAVEEAIPDAVGIAGAFDRYREILAEDELLDFDEQIYLALELLLTRPELRAHAQSRARHVLVDEFQDLNPAHLLLIRLLAAPAYDVFGVGDDDQVIYSYAGATPEYLINYDRYFGGASPYALETNYRCPPPVVSAARSLLTHNRRRIGKSIAAAAGRSAEPGQIRVVHRPAADHASASLDEIRKWSAGGAMWSGIAVLARVNAALLPIQVTLLESGIPCTTPLGTDVLNRTGIRAALAYLRIGAQPDRIKKADVAETIRRPSRKIARNVTEMLQRRSTTSVEGIRSLADALSGGDVDKLHAYASDLDLVAQALDGGTTAAVLRTIRTEVSLGSAMDALDSARNEVDHSTHLDDLAALEQVAVLYPDPVGFEGWLRDVLSTRTPDRSEAEGTIDRVTLSTVHRVKGQEWPHVLVLGASEDLFPHRLTSDIEEERRVFHVAITRCSEDVVVMADTERPSRFCAELFAEAAPLAPGSAVAPPPGRPETETPLDRLRRRPDQAPKARAAVPGIADGPPDPGRERLSASLRDWRRSTAQRDKVPAYVVLSDAYLDGITAARPATLNELARCKGIGPAKLEKYGDEILALVESAGA